MSGILWHTEGGEDVRLAGAERGHMGVWTKALYMKALGLDHWVSDEERAWFRRVFGVRGEGEHLKTEMYLFGMSSVPPVVRLADGRTVDIFALELNTALRMGNDAVKLMARLHGQCELHCWVEGKNRAWLAGIIEEGLRLCVLRRQLRGHSLGWDRVVTLLRERDDAPVVTSFTVCNSFPEIIGDPAETTWAQGMDWLRRECPALELKPDNWQRYHFGEHDVSALELHDLTGYFAPGGEDWVREQKYAAR